MTMRIWPLLLAALLALAVVACGDDDDDAAGDDDAPTDIPTGAVATETPAPGGPIALTSDAFESGQPIPADYTCDGENISPSLSWSGVPEETASIAIEMVDPDAGGYVHWVLFDLPPGITGLPAGVPTGADADFASKQAINTSGETGYSGPCPPGGQTHQYVFRVYALDAKLDLPAGGSAQNVQEALAVHTLAMTELVGTYGR